MATYSGTIDLRVTGNAEQKAELIKKRINDIKNIANSLKPVPNLFDKRGNDAILKAKEELKKLVEQYGKGTGTGNRFSNTIAGLNQQLNGFNRVLGNVNVKSDEFVQSLTASEKVSRRLARAEAERLQVLTRINTANTVGRATSVQETLDLGKIIPRSVAGLELYQRELQDTLRNVRIGSKDYQELARAIADVNRQLAVAQGQGPVQGPALPPGFNERGRIPGARRRGSRLQDIATGAGFPLLFGGGPLQALAGGVGGAFGGLGGSIAASAIASQVEAFAQAATEAGQALNSTGGALDFMREKSLFSTAAVEERAAVLEEQGKVEELASLLTQELTDKIGNEGVRSLQELGKTTDETTRLWSELTTQLFKLISGPLNSFLKIVNQVLGAVAGAGRREAFFGDLGSQEQAARARFQQLTGQNLGTGRSGVKRRREAEAAGQVFLSQEEALAQIRKEFQPVSPVSIPVTDADRRRFAVKDTAGAKAAREEERIRQRLAALEVERQKILEISGFKDKIAAAEAANDSQLVIRLQGQQRLADIEAKRLTDLTKVKDQRLIDAINITAATEKLAAQREIERQLAEDQRKRQELFETTIEGLEHQLEMAEATSQAERDRLKIARELKKLEEKGFTGDQLAQAGGIMQRLAAAQQPLNMFIRKTTEDLNNLQQVAVDVSQGIGNAIGNSLVSGLQSLVTGAASVREVFAKLLRSVADVLANTAAKMIAQYIAIGIARAFAGMGDGGGSEGPNLDAIQQYSGIGADTPVTPLATGGYVSSPTRALIGEGSEPEYVIPESKMRESMARYSRGSRGPAVIPESGASGASGEGGGTAIATPIDVRYTVERINSVDYVTADQFQAGMQQAAAQGAKQGEQQTLKRLQMSGSTRKRIGL